MTQNSVSDTELIVETAKTNTNKVNSDVQNGQDRISLVKRLRRLITLLTVEPLLICFIFPKVILSLAGQLLYLDKACRTDLQNPDYICADVIAGNFDENNNSTSGVSAAYTQTQTLIAEMTTWKQPLEIGIPAILILFFGAWSDRTGNRKALMVLPILGEFISTLGLMLSTYFFEWPLWVNGLIEVIPVAITGGLTVILMASFSFITDVTTIESRTFRIGLVAVIVTRTIPVGSALSGVLIKTVGYYGVFGLSLGSYGVGLIYTYFRIKDIKQQSMGGSCSNRLIELYHPKNAWETLSLVFLSRGYDLIKIVLVIFTYVIIMGPVVGQSSMFYLYLLQKYQFTVDEFKFFSAYSIFMGVTGTSIVIFVFSKWLKIHDATIGIPVVISRVGGDIMYGLAPTKGWIYAAPVIDIFGNTGVTIVKSMGTKIVPTDKVGKLFSLLGLMEAIIPLIYRPIYTRAYIDTAETFPGAIYIFGAIMTVPAVFIFIFLYYLNKKQDRDIVKSPAQKEMYARENAVTVL